MTKLKRLEIVLEEGRTEQEKVRLIAKAIRIRRRILKNKGIEIKEDPFKNRYVKRYNKDERWKITDDALTGAYHFEGLYATIEIEYIPPENPNQKAKLIARMLGTESTVYEAFERANLDDPFI